MDDIDEIITRFIGELKKKGIDEESSSLLIQVRHQRRHYIRGFGMLDNIISNETGANSTRHNLPDFLQTEIELATVRDSTKIIHNDTLKLIRLYSPEATVEQVDLDYIQRLEGYMNNELGLSINTIARHMKTLKRYINLALKKGIITKYPFLNYTIKSEQTNRQALNEKELETLEKYRNQLETPNEVLNAFLFSCYTGLRFSDIRVITKQHIVTVNRKKWLVHKMIKTNKVVRIPLQIIFGGKALEISKSINRNKGCLFKIGNNQHANRELVRIARNTGLKEFTFHCARHTCATLLLYRGVSITTVQAILGHQSVKTTQIYSAVTDLTLERELKKSNSRNRKF